MSYDVNCAACQAVQGACMDCGGCFLRHCQCDPCQHGHARSQINDCPACRPATTITFSDEALDRILDHLEIDARRAAEDEGGSDGVE